MTTIVTIANPPDGRRLWVTPTEDLKATLAEAQKRLGPTAKAARVEVDDADAALVLKLAMNKLGTDADGWARTTDAKADSLVVAQIAALVASPPMIRPNWAGVIRRLRTELLGANQTNFGRIAGVSPSVVSRWESGILEPGSTELYRLQRFFLAVGLDWPRDLQEGVASDDPRAKPPTRKAGK